MHWADMSHGRSAASRINELSGVPMSSTELLAHPGSTYSTMSSQLDSMSTMPLGNPGMPMMDDPMNEQARVMALQRQSAQRHVSGKGGFQARGRPVSQAQGTPCPHCKGTHPDIPNGKCPTVGSASQDTEFKSNPENKKKFCHWMCNRKFRCNGEGHLARHHRQELEAAGVRIAPRDAGGPKGGGKSFGRFRNSKSGPQTRGYKRSIRAVVDNALVPMNRTMIVAL